jgi:hypothetical protein
LATGFGYKLTASPIKQEKPETDGSNQELISTHIKEKLGVDQEKNEAAGAKIGFHRGARRGSFLFVPPCGGTDKNTHKKININ